MQGTAYYNGNSVIIMEVWSDKALIIINHNPIECDWVKVSELDRIVWHISAMSA